jgi:hypothetical protein
MALRRMSIAPARMIRTMRTTWLLAAFSAAAVWLPATPAHADLLGGLADLVQGVISLPVNVLAGTLSGPPVLGTVGGVLTGTVNTINYTARGLLGVAGAAIPTASTLAPLLPFLF